MKKKTTIYDIAQNCQLSTATVSRVLSGSSYPVSEKNRKKILDASAALKYTPNLIGKSLKTAQISDIGVVLPNMSSYYSILLQAIQDVAYKYSAQIVLCNSFRDPVIEEKNVGLLLQKQINGILIVTIDDNEKILKDIIDAGVTVVAMEQGVKADCLRTYFNYQGGAVMAVEHLIGLGHRKVAFASSPLLRSSRKELAQGYRSALLANGIEVEEKYLFIYPEESSKEDEQFYDFEVGKRAAANLMALSSPPTAIFCINDMIAIGVIRELFRMGKRVPEDVSVVGFDNIPFSEMLSPTITTIDQCTYELGKASAELLFNNMESFRSKEDASTPHISLRLEPKLISRESTKTI